MAGPPRVARGGASAAKEETEWLWDDAQGCHSLQKRPEGEEQAPSGDTGTNVAVKAASSSRPIVATLAVAFRPVRATL